MEEVNQDGENYIKKSFKTCTGYKYYCDLIN